MKQKVKTIRKKALQYASRLLLALGATCWMIIVYFVKERYTIYKLPPVVAGVLLCILALLFSRVIIYAARNLDVENTGKCTSFEVADDTYLPVYLGYFFVALGVDDCYVLAFVYVIILFYSMLMNVYFNPAFILLGFHYYYVINENGTRLSVICKSSGRNPDDIRFDDLRRINNWTFISFGGDGK